MVALRYGNQANGTCTHTHTHTHTHTSPCIDNCRPSAKLQSDEMATALLNALWSVVAVALSKTNKHTSPQPPLPHSESVWRACVCILIHNPVFESLQATPLKLYKHTYFYCINAKACVNVSVRVCVCVHVFSNNYLSQN